MRNAIIAIEDQRFYENRGVDLRGIGRALFQDVVSRRRGPGRLDDHPAVRQERAAGPGQAHGLREAARGGARLPPDAQVVQAEDPHRVPELDLLRQRRLRDRVGRAHLLRRRPDHVDCGTRGDPCASQLDARRGGAARRHRRLAQRLRPARTTRGAPSAGATSCSRTCSSRATSREPSTTQHRRVAPGPSDDQAAHGGLEAPVLHDLGPPAARRPLRRPARVRGRPEDPTTLDLTCRRPPSRRSTS